MAINPWLTWWVWAWATVLALSNPTWVSTSINAFSAAATWITTWTKTLVTNILWKTWVAKVWALAPFAAPVVGWMIWYKVADWLWAEWKPGKFVWAWLWSLAWAAAFWAWALAWSFAPVILGAGWIYAGYKTLGWTWGKLRWKGKTAAA